MIDNSLSQGKSLLNFKVPNHLKETFDVVCHSQGHTRTSALIFLMQQYVQEQSPKIRSQQKSSQQKKSPGTTIKSREKFFGYGNDW
tara:strand:+ start:249 stop:506 length:258 start_codon:yes stop_codon:yes gene_type:complete